MQPLYAQASHTVTLPNEAPALSGRELRRF